MINILTIYWQDDFWDPVWHSHATVLRLCLSVPQYAAHLWHSNHPQQWGSSGSDWNYQPALAGLDSNLGSLKHTHTILNLSNVSPYQFKSTNIIPKSPKPNISRLRPFSQGLIKLCLCIQYNYKIKLLRFFLFKNHKVPWLFSCPGLEVEACIPLKVSPRAAYAFCICASFMFEGICGVAAFTFAYGPVLTAHSWASLCCA